MQFCSVSDAGFRMVDPNWIFLLFAIVAASSMVSDTEAVALRHLAGCGKSQEFCNEAARGASD